VPPSIIVSPIVSGLRGGTASSQRPVRTAISIGTSAKSAMTTPTVKADALLASAYSEPFRRAEASAKCASTEMAMMRDSLIGQASTPPSPRRRR
jgi:hypothetical protein